MTYDGFSLDSQDSKPSGMSLSRCAFIAVVLVTLIVGVGVGVLIGYFARPSSAQEKLMEKLTAGADSSIRQKLLDSIDANNIRTYLKDLTEHPHLAGTPADKQQAEELGQFWDALGLRTEVVPYHVLLSYPDKDNPNRIELQDSSGAVVYTTQLVEKIVRPEQNQSDVVPPFNAYSAPGTPKGDLIYVNYARIEDFIWLSEEKGVDFTDKICIARYGRIFRGDKAKNAELYNASGLIMFTDPRDYAPAGWDEVYPESWMLPGTGVQRGSLFLDDPISPGYPDIESAHRIAEDDSGLPRIPVHPIGYDDAYHLLSRIGGEDAPDEWQGSLNFTYKLGPGFTEPNWKVQMHISTSNRNATTYNTFGFIEGTVEPDRYVLLGNHRDAWVFGALDPSSGTAVMMELSRAMAELVKEGWKPRRSIVFCSWGAEEYGLVGSREWVENFGHILGDRAVAYLNVDIAVQGNHTFRGRGLPMMFDLMFDVAKSVPNPNSEEIANGRPTMYDTWLAERPETAPSGPTGRPLVPILGSGSDFAPFIGKVGVSCSDLRYTYDSSLGLSSYPLYHSVYETFHLYDTFIDPGFSYSKAIGQYWGELARRLADELLLPFDVEEYGSAIESYAKSIHDGYGSSMIDNGLGVGLDYLDEAVEKFSKATKDFKAKADGANKNDPMIVRQLNDQMMQLERKFIDPLGLPDRPLTRNIVFAPSAHNSYAGASFPGLVDTMFGIDKVNEDEKIARWDQVAKQLSIVTFFIENAAASLQEPLLFHNI